MKVSGFFFCNSSHQLNFLGAILWRQRERMVMDGNREVMEPQYKPGLTQVIFQSNVDRDGLSDFSRCVNLGHRVSSSAEKLLNAPISCLSLASVLRCVCPRNMRPIFLLDSIFQ